MRPPPRTEREEILDAPGSERSEIVQTLDHVASATIRMGGIGPLADALGRLCPGKGPLQLLDVGAGNGAVASALASRLRARGIATRWTLVDVSAEILVTARRTGHAGVVCDALRLPFAPHAFDAAVSVLTLHHFGPETAVALLREMGRVTRFGLVVSDLRRSVPGWWGARFLAATVWRGNRLTRHDAPLSVLRSYTPDEAVDLAERAGLHAPVVRRHPPFRMVLRAGGSDANDGERHR